jgi:MoaA/NifB/PqqE/SkfB family radical SAM enzyme
MIKYNQIKSVHLEISSRCNAMCPSCPRNFHGVDVVDNYPICDLRLDQIKKIFPVEFLKQLDNILINGNYGDFVTARDAVSIIEYFYQANPRLYIEVSTNGSAQPKIWASLGKFPVQIAFRLDGLNDTHHLYRQNTEFNFIIDNAKKFIAAGGYAIWTMIVFDHNEHQIEQCQAMSRELGFRQFRVNKEPRNSRNQFPVFTPDRRLSHVVGEYTGSTDFDFLWQRQNQHDARLSIKYHKESYPIKCKAQASNQIYIASDGNVYPCCWLGFSPLTDDTRPENLQMRDFLKENNAIEYGIEHAIGWFNHVEESWSKSSVADGKLSACNETCGIR